MSLLLPQFYLASPSHCSGARYGSRRGPAAKCGPSKYLGPSVWSFLENTFDEIQRASTTVERSFTPRFDVQESNDHFTLTGEVPGVSQEDISIEFTDEKTINIRGHTETLTKTGTSPQPDQVQTTGPAEPTSSEGAATPASTSTRTLQATVEDEEDEAANNGEHEWIDVTANEKQKQKQPAEPQTQDNNQETVAEQQQAKEAEKTDLSPTEPRSWLSERHYGQFSRTFQFTTRVDRYAVTASLKNGLLKIVVPKAAAPESRRINIE